MEGRQLSSVPQNSEFEEYSQTLAKRVTRGALGEIQTQNAICIWCHGILKQATHLSGMYSFITNKVYSAAMREAAAKYLEHYTLMHKIIPWADKGASQIVSETNNYIEYSKCLLNHIMGDVKQALKHHVYLQKLRCLANVEANAIMKQALKEYSMKPKFEMTVVDYDEPSEESLGGWAKLYTEKILKDATLVLTEKKTSKAQKKTKRFRMRYAEYNSSCNNNKGINDAMSTSSESDVSTHEKEFASNDIYRSYAEGVVMDLCSVKKLKESYMLPQLSSHQKLGQYESSDSISNYSDLSSPHSSVDSRGLHHFADKLLYSLSILENHSSDLSVDSIESNACIIKDCRRSSAPALLTGHRRASLRTVFEGGIFEDPQMGDREMRHGYHTSRLHQRRHHSIQESEGIRLPSRVKLGEEKYGDLMARNILCCAYKDFV